MTTKIETKIIYSQNPQFKFTNGAFGAINAEGYFTINFFFDRPKDAEAFNVEISDNPHEIKQFFNSNESVREVHTQVVMDLKTAKSVADWINSNIASFSDFIK